MKRIIFDSETRDWINVILNFLEHEWNLSVHLTWTDDIDYFNRFSKNRINEHSSRGGSMRDTGLIYINAKSHSNFPKAELLNTLVHEALHVRFPKATEKLILTLSNAYVGVQE